MSNFQLPNGSKLQLGNAFGTERNFTAMTNAADPVLTVTSNTGGTAIAAGDAVMITESTTSMLDKGVFYVKAADETSITLLGSNGRDFTIADDYPPTTTGKLAKITGWIDLPYVTDIANAGGDAQTTTINPVQLDKGIDIFTGTAASTTTLTFTHDSTDAVRAPLTAATRNQKPLAYRIINPKASAGKGEHRVVGVKTSFNPVPTMSVGEVEVVTAAFTFLSDMNFYTTDKIPVAPVV